VTVITMSRNELTRLRVLIDVAHGRLSVAGSTGLIGVGRRQIYRLADAFRGSTRARDRSAADGRLDRGSGPDRRPARDTGLTRICPYSVTVR
jgi:hypothetical protein